MAVSHPPFASSEYVKRWLSKVESKLTTHLQAEITPPRPSERKHERRSYQNLKTEIPASPPRYRKRIADEISRSPLRKKLHFMEEETGSDKGGQGCPSSSASNHSAVITVENHVSISSAREQTALKDRSQNYARQSRHKTKPDRYEYKGDAVEEVIVEKTSKQRSKRSRRRKTGDVLNHEFKAPNVGQERLTLKTTPLPGIFSKGKASALLQIRGLPDLTFSEMNFLSKKRISDQGEIDKQKQSKSAKKDKSKEISDFFAKLSGGVAGPRQTSSEELRLQHSTGYTDEGVSPAISSPAKLASRTELSLASDNMSAPRGASEMTKQMHMSNVHDKAAHSPRSVRSNMPAVDMAIEPVEASTSYCPWSMTLPLPDSSRSIIPAAADVTNEQRQSTHRTDFSLVRGSSVTNSSLDRYTKRLLLNRDQNGQRQYHRVASGTNFYSLDDLKGLAQLAQIEEKYWGVPETAPRRLSSVESIRGPTVPCISAPYGERSEAIERNHLATTQPDIEILTERSARRTLNVTPSFFQLRPLYTGNEQQNEGLPRRTAGEIPVSLRREVVTMPQCPTDVELLMRHNRTGYVQSGHHQTYPLDEQDFRHTEQHQHLVTAHLGEVPELDMGAFEECNGKYGDCGKSYFYEDTVHETFGMGFDEHVSKASEVDDEIPELQGLRYGEEMGEQFVGCDEAEVGQVVDYNHSREGLGIHVDDTFRDSGQRIVSDRGRERISRWNGRSTMTPEAEFSGFSRPQILY